MSDIQLLGTFGIVGLIAIGLLILISSIPKSKNKAMKNQDDPIYNIESSFEDTLKTLSFSDLLGLLAMGNSVYIESDDKTAFEQLCMAESELLYRFMEDLLTSEQRRMTEMYFENPETILDKVKFSFVQS